jgi:hypothetical protein
MFVADLSKSRNRLEAEKIRGASTKMRAITVARASETT